MNFSNCDAPYNAQYYKPGHPETEISVMGCRSRVIGNIHNPKYEIYPGRGNLYFITVSLPWIALEAKRELEQSGHPWDQDTLIDLFFSKLDTQVFEVFDILYRRLEIVGKKKAKNFPFLMGQGLYVDSEKLMPDDEVMDVLKNGSLTTAYIGLAETLIALTGKHHGESDASQELGLKIVKHMYDLCVARSKETKLNYTLMGSPAEGCCGRLLRCARKEFGTIKGVTDHAYLTNSSHLPVFFNTSAKHKIDIEAPYHQYCNAGCILYIEMDGDPSQNVDAFEQVVNYMAEKNANYYSINHPVDRDPICGYSGIIPMGGRCPRCGRKENEPVSAAKLLSLTSYSPDPKYALKFQSEEEQADTVAHDISDLISPQ